jgi:hypothetical protein
MRFSKKRQAAAEEARRRDLDETRRLLYMALCAPRTKRYELAGTLINAIAHHQNAEVRGNELVDRVVAFVNDDAPDDDWLRQQIARVALPDTGEV